MFSSLCPEIYFLRAPPPYPETLDWITENEDFKSWLKFPEASNLHLFGKPGSGKTVMSAWLARTLQKKRFKSRAVLFHSFNTHDDRRSSVKRLLLSFVQQLLLYGQSVINSHVKQVFEFTKKRDGSLSTVGLWLLLRSMLCFRKDSDERYQQRTDDSHSPQYTHVICIIDGIDGINDSYQIDELLREINRLRTLTDDMVVKFILTSRNDPAIRTALERIPDHFSIDIEDNSKDVRSQSIGKRLHELDGPSKELVEKTEKKLSSLDATYLQLDLILKPPQHTTICIKHQLTENNQDPESTRLEEISKLQPTELSLSSLYAQKVSQIPVEDWDQSLYVLGWLIYSIHPLSIGQLATAVAIKYGAKSLTEVAANHRITAETLQRRFGPLIIFDGQEVQLVHSTFREYVLEGELEGPDLQRLASLRDSGKIHADHARVCINYLRFEEFIPTPQPSNLVEFFDYAAQHWSTHFRNSRVEANGLNNTIAFVRDKEAAPHWFSRYWDLEYAPYGIKMTCYEIPQTVKPDTENTVVNPEYSGVEDKTDGRKYSPGESSEEDEVFSQKGGPEEGPEDGTKGGAETDGAEEPAKLMAPCYEFPLYISATLGLTPVIEKLLSDPEVPYPISDQLTALDIAALYGHLPVVKIILALHAIEYPQSGIIKALQSSCKAGHVPVVVELLANVTNQGLWGDNRPTPVDVTDEAVKEEARIVNHEAGDIEGASEGSTEVQSDVPKGTQDDIQEDTEKDAPEEPEKDAPVDSKDAPEEPKDAPEKPNDTPEEPNDTPEEPSDAQEDANDAPEDANDAPEDADDTPEDANDVSEEIKIKDHESGEQEKAIVDNMRDCHYAAARSGHTQVVRLLIERGAIVDSPGSLLPCAPLWAASYSGFADVVEELLKAGANPNFFESDRLTPLQISAFRGHTEVVRVLLSNHNPRHHVDVDMVNFGCAPIHLAAEYGHTYVVRELLQNKATIDLITEISPSTAMHLASGGGHLGVLRLLLDRQADMEAKDETGNTPLHIASQYGHSTAVDLLIEQGADVEATSDGRVTPLMCASCYGYSAIVIKLLNSGTSIDATTKEDKFSAFYYACVNGHEKIMDIFIRNGVDVDKTDVYNQTPLNSACLLNMVGSVKKLLEHGADVFHSYDDGRTVLYDAVLSKNVEIVKVVIEAMLTRSGDTKLQTELSGYPLNKAIYFEVEDIIRLLLDNGANVAYVTSTGETLFSQKWTAESETSFQLLLDHANSEAISVLDKWGRSPLFLAAAYHYENATKFLLDRGADKNQVDIFGRRPIDITSKPEVMQLLTGKLAKKLTCRWMYPRINCNLWIKCDECQLSTADAENDKPFFFYRELSISSRKWLLTSDRLLHMLGRQLGHLLWML